MSRKITKEEFLGLFKKRFPQSDIEIIQYTAISKPAVIRCKKCGKEFYNKVARQVISNFHCCGSDSEDRYKRVKRLLEDNKDYKFVKKANRKSYIIIKHEVCGNEFRRSVSSVIDNPFSCPYCNIEGNKAKSALEQAQGQIKGIKIIEYKGVDKRNLYKCLKCGFMFYQKQARLIQLGNCPKCKRNENE